MELNSTLRKTVLEKTMMLKSAIMIRFLTVAICEMKIYSAQILSTAHMIWTLEVFVLYNALKTYKSLVLRQQLVTKTASGPKV